MKKLLKYLFIGMTCVFLVSGKMSIEGYAKSCTHKYNNDICKNCGYVRVHEFAESILFYTAKENIPIWNMPTKKSKLVRKIANKDSMVEFNGLLRNQFGNIWLRTEDGYVFIDNVYLNFESLVARSYQQIYALGEDAVLVAFYDEVHKHGTADYKIWLDPSSKGILYNVYIDGQFVKMTAEQLGNINYGYLGKLVGFTDDVLLHAAGAVNLLTVFETNKWDTTYKEALKQCAVCDTLLCNSIEKVCALNSTPKLIMADIINNCSNSYCDTAEDATDVKRGITYYDTGEFK
ncbi:MAG: hypothetical protein IJ429_01965 [Lachnospiraceae bacterium]|nr:hypothetical protein [Lachnospiraceae bacterium]